MSYYGKHISTPSPYSHHDWRTTNEYHSVQPGYSKHGHCVKDVHPSGHSGFSNNFSITRYHMVSHEGPVDARSLAVKKQPKAMHEAEQHVVDVPRFDPTSLLGTATWKPVDKSGKDNGYGRNNKGNPDASVRLPQDRLVHPLNLDRISKSHPTDAEQSGLGPAKFSTSTAQTFKHPLAQPDMIPAQARVLNPEMNGFTTNIPPSIRPVTPREEYNAFPPLMAHEKRKYKFDTACKGSMSQSIHSWQRPTDPDPNSAVLKVEPSPAGLHYHGKAQVPAVLHELGPVTSTYKMHPSTAKAVATKDPIEYSYKVDAGHIGGTTTASAHGPQGEAPLVAAINFQNSMKDSKSAGFEGNFAHQAYHLQRPSDHSGTTSAHEHATKTMGHSLTAGPDKQLRSKRVISGYTRSIFSSTSAPSKGNTFDHSKALNKLHPYSSEARPMTERSMPALIPEPWHPKCSCGMY